MHSHVPLDSGAVAEPNVLPLVLTTMRGSSSGNIHLVLWALAGI